MEYTFLQATAQDVERMYSLLMEHGPNDWNYLPAKAVQEELSDIAHGKALGLLVELSGNLIGFAVAYPGFVRFPEHSKQGVSKEHTGYIGDVVVHREHVGKGLGVALLTQAKQVLTDRGIKEIHIDCHEENLASRGMMRKAGFVELALFYDPRRRSVGSKNTWIGRFCCEKGEKSE